MKDGHNLANHDSLDSEISTSFNTDIDEAIAEDHDGIQDDEALFLEESFAVHKNTADSMMTPATSFKKGIVGEDHALILTPSSEKGSDEPPSSPLAPKSANRGHSLRQGYREDRGQNLPRYPPTPLIELPTATDINHAHPATLTANLLVGVTEIKSRRVVTIRRNGRSADLLDVVVADDFSKQGFSISFWLDHVVSHARLDNLPQHSPKQDLEKDLSEVRIGDVVLMTNIGLSQWRGTVHGTSLARGSWRTEVGLVWRRAYGWSRLGRELGADGIHPVGTLRSTWQSRTRAVKAFVKTSVALPFGKDEMSSHADTSDHNMPARRLDETRWLPKDDTQEI
ncbi:MAG: hypothetical protein Q9159_000511 [Coniocarpon cinnabarinum]